MRIPSSIRGRRPVQALVAASLIAVFAPSAYATTPPAAPTGLTAVAGPFQITLSWTSTSGASTYNIYRGSAAGAEPTAPFVTKVVGTSYADDIVATGVKYYYKVAAVNAGGSSSLSVEASTATTATASTHLSWVNSTNALGLWNYTPSTGAFTSVVYGPYTGWTPVSIGDGVDGLTRALWVNSTGEASIWSVNNAAGTFSQFLFGPYSGWTAKATSVGSDNTTHLLWTSTSGQASLWNVQSSGALTQHTFGPFSGWSATAIADGPDGQTRLLWTNANGEASIWSLSSATGAFSQQSFGPYSGWKAAAMSVGSDNTTHVLWDSSGGGISLWNYNTATGGFTQHAFGPYAGWAPESIADGADGLVRLEWRSTGGVASIWAVNSATGSFTQHSYGPYSGWTSQQVSAWCGEGSADISLINQVIRGQIAPAVSNIQPLANGYAVQLSEYPADLATNAGYAMMQSALSVAVLAQVNGLQTTPQSLSLGGVSSGKPGIAQVAADVTPWGIPVALSGGSPGLSVADFLPDVSISATSLDEQADLRQADARLALAEQAYDVVLASPTYILPGVQNYNDIKNENDTLNLGSAEFEVLLTGTSLARAAANAATAYDADPGTFNFSEPVSTAFATQYQECENSIGKSYSIPVSEYLPPSPFGTLSSDGKPRILTLQSEVEASATSAIAAITDVENRNNNGFLLNPGTLISDSELNQYTQEINQYKAYLTSEETITVHGVSANLDLPVFFANPPKDLKTLMPTISVVAPDDYSDITLSIAPSQFPDLTFGGLFPGGDTLLGTYYDYSWTGDTTPEGTVIGTLFDGSNGD